MVIYFLLVIVGSVIAARLILGELRKERRDYIKVNPSEISKTISDEHRTPPPIDRLSVLAEHSDRDLLERVQKVEELLAEKNAELVKLTNTLEAERRHKNEFEKIKSLLQWQIFETRQMNKQIKQELDSLTIQRKQFQDEASHLKTELIYKEEILVQNEQKISELNNRLRNFLSIETSASEPHIEKKTDAIDHPFQELDWRTKLSE